MKRKPIIIAAGAVVLGTAWALFRPELLFVNQKVSEAFPVATTEVANAAPVVAPMDANPTTPELTGQFHKGAHETKGTASIYKLKTNRYVYNITVTGELHPVAGEWMGSYASAQERATKVLLKLSGG